MSNVEEGEDSRVAVMSSSPNKLDEMDTDDKDEEGKKAKRCCNVKSGSKGHSKRIPSFLLASLRTLGSLRTQYVSICLSNSTS